MNSCLKDAYFVVQCIAVGGQLPTHVLAIKLVGLAGDNLKVRNESY